MRAQDGEITKPGTSVFLMKLEQRTFDNQSAIIRFVVKILEKIPSVVF